MLSSMLCELISGQGERTIHGMPRHRPNDWKREVGARLEATRLALGFDHQADMCREIKAEPNTWNQWERGVRLIDLGVAIRLCSRFGLTLDWIYRGDMAGLPLSLAGKVRRFA